MLECVFVTALKLLLGIRVEEGTENPCPTQQLKQHLRVKTKLCRKINFYFIIWKDTVFPTTANRFSTESQTQMDHKKLAELLSFPIQICTKISTKIRKKLFRLRVR